jgi:hypothetical protein
MNFADWLVNIALVALVLRQIRWNRIDRRFILLPLILVGVAASNYLKTVPTAGNDLVLVIALMTVGITFGGLSAWATTVRTEGGTAFVRARGLSVVLWIAGIGSRMAFELYATHGGAPSIAHFSASHHITSMEAWTAALVLMALAEVITRVGILALRGHRALATSSSLASVTPMQQRVAA